MGSLAAKIPTQGNADLNPLGALRESPRWPSDYPECEPPDQALEFGLSNKANRTAAVSPRPARRFPTRCSACRRSAMSARNATRLSTRRTFESTAALLPQLGRGKGSRRIWPDTRQCHQVCEVDGNRTGLAQCLAELLEVCRSLLSKPKRLDRQRYAVLTRPRELTRCRKVANKRGPDCRHGLGARSL